jgi:hypothetical protein
MTISRNLSSIPNTITANTIIDSTGNTVPIATVVKGAAKAWVYFSGITTVTIGQSFNVTSVTRNGTGYYTVNFTNAMPTATYSVLGSSTRATNTTAASTDMNCQNVIVDQTTSSFVIKTGYPQNINTVEDSANVRCVVFSS